MEIMFLILSGVILAAGVLYWFWSHINLTQKKVQLLENAVFELRGMVGPKESPDPPAELLPAGQAEVYRDLDDDDWKEEAPVPQVQQVVQESSPPPPPVMQPLVVSPVIAREEPASDQFRELFVENESMKADQAQTLEGLSLKELRRMATERGIATNEMKKKELITALRNTVHPGLAPLEAHVEKEEMSSLDVPELS